MGFEMDESNTTIYQVTNSNDKFWFDPFFYCFHWWQSHYAKDGDDEEEDDDDDGDVDDDHRLTISPKPISRGGCGLLEVTSINPN